MPLVLIIVLIRFILEITQNICKQSFHKLFFKTHSYTILISNYWFIFLSNDILK